MARNREAYHEYFVEEEFEAGIELVGTEVKSIRAGNLNLKDAWCGIKDGQLLLNQMHISPYDHGNRFNVDARRPRRLLMHKREIMRLYGKVKQDGFALIPLSVYFKGSRVKVNVGLCLVGVIIGEFLAARRGLGYLIIYGSQVFQLDCVMLSIVLLCLFSALLYKLIAHAETTEK